MSMDAPAAGPGFPAAGTTSLLVELARFAQVVRTRLGTLAVCLCLGGAVGVAVFVLAKRVYESSAEILVLQTGGTMLDSKSGGQQRSIQDFLPTYQKVLVSDTVLERVISRCRESTASTSAASPKRNGPRPLRERLSVSSARQTHVINVAYSSYNAETAAYVVGAVLDTYMEFMVETHRSNSKDQLEVLTGEKRDLERQLREKGAELLRMKQSSGVLLTGGEHKTHVLVERAMELSKASVEGTKRRLEAEALLIAIRDARWSPAATFNSS